MLVFLARGTLTNFFSSHLSFFTIVAASRSILFVSLRKSFLRVPRLKRTGYASDVPCVKSAEILGLTKRPAPICDAANVPRHSTRSAFKRAREVLGMTGICG